jgi:ribosome-associated protein
MSRRRKNSKQLNSGLRRKRADFSQLQNPPPALTSAGESYRKTQPLNSNRTGERTIDAREKARFISEAASKKEAEDIVVMNMEAVSNIARYFVICSASSTRRVNTVAEGIEEDLLKVGQNRWHIEGMREGIWVVIDYGDVLAHIFYKKIRDFYNLERLWHDVPKERFFAQCTLAKSSKT